MNRKKILASTAALPNAFLQAQQPITHVDTVRDGKPLKSSVVKERGYTRLVTAPGQRRQHLLGPFVRYCQPLFQFDALERTSPYLP
jgi:hypothetical protein